MDDRVLVFKFDEMLDQVRIRSLCKEVHFNGLLRQIIYNSITVASHTLIQTHNLSKLAELIIYATGPSALVSPAMRLQPPTQVISIFLIAPNISAVWTSRTCQFIHFIYR